MQRKIFGILSLAGILISLGAVGARPGGDDVPFPNGFRDWFAVNSMIVTKDSPIFGRIGGMHIIYVNATGLPTLKKGGSLPYPDGTVFADDVHEFLVKDGSYVEGNKKAVTVMVKDAKKYATTGGWGFQVWPGATLRNHSSLTPRMPSKLALSATHLKKAKTTHFQPTFTAKRART
jgi:Cytochrome P460